MIEIQELLRRRWSPRAFAQRPVEGEKLSSLLEAARWAPSCFNEQPWAFVVTTRQQPGEFERLLGCLVEANRVWAAAAPVLMLSVAKLNFHRDGKPNRHAFHDVGLAAENLVIQGLALDLYVHQMAGFDVEKARVELAIPPAWEPVAAIAVGYLGDPATLPEKLAQRETAPRTRKRPEEFVFDGRWGVASRLTFPPA